MAVLFMDGFSHLATPTDTTLAKYDYVNQTPVINSAGGRFFGDSLQFNGSSEYVEKVFDENLFLGRHDATKSMIGIGFAFKYTVVGSTTAQIVSFMDGNFSEIASIRWDSQVDFEMELYTGGILRGTSGTALVLDDWNYVEMKVTVGPEPFGTAELKINGTSVVSVSGVDSEGTAGRGTSVIRIGPQSNLGTFEIDDLYIIDNTGSSNTDLIGPVTIETLFPSGAGTTANFTPSTGSNFENVDDATPDGDTTYNSSSTATNKDTFAYDNLTTSAATIYAVQTNINANKQAAGQRELSDVARSGSTDYDGSNFSVNQNYWNHETVREVDPDTSSAWTVSGVNAAEFGYKIQT